MHTPIRRSSGSSLQLLAVVIVAADRDIEEAELGILARLELPRDAAVVDPAMVGIREGKHLGSEAHAEKADLHGRLEGSAGVPVLDEAGPGRLQIAENLVWALIGKHTGAVTKDPDLPKGAREAVAAVEAVGKAPEIDGCETMQEGIVLETQEQVTMIAIEVDRPVLLPPFARPQLKRSGESILRPRVLQSSMSGRAAPVGIRRAGRKLYIGFPRGHAREERLLVAGHFGSSTHCSTA
jgi:hypothetical protein